MEYVVIQELWIKYTYFQFKSYKLTMTDENDRIVKCIGGDILSVFVDFLKCIFGFSMVSNLNQFFACAATFKYNMGFRKEYFLFVFLALALMKQPFIHFFARWRSISALDHNNMKALPSIHARTYVRYIYFASKSRVHTC